MKCILNNEKICNDCGECDNLADMCDLEPNKICDNCYKCLDEGGSEYRSLNLTDYALEHEPALYGRRKHVERKGR